MSSRSRVPSFGVRRDKILFHKITPFQEIRVARRKNRLKLYFIEDDEEYLQSEMSLNNPHYPLPSYINVLQSALLAPIEPRNVLVIGLGGGAIPRIWSRLFPKCRFRCLEVDRVVHRVARKYFQLPPTNVCRVTLGDADLLIAELPRQSFDFVILDAFQGCSIPDPLIGEPFLDQVSEILQDAGVLVVNLHQGVGYLKRYFSRLCVRFPNNLFFRMPGRLNVIQVGRRSGWNWDSTQIRQRMAELDVLFKPIGYDPRPLLSWRVSSPFVKG